MHVPYADDADRNRYSTIAGGTVASVRRQLSTVIIASMTNIDVKSVSSQTGSSPFTRDRVVLFASPIDTSALYLECLILCPSREGKFRARITAASELVELVGEDAGRCQND